MHRGDGQPLQSLQQTSSFPGELRFDASILLSGRTKVFDGKNGMQVAPSQPILRIKALSSLGNLSGHRQQFRPCQKACLQQLYATRVSKEQML